MTRGRGTAISAGLIMEIIGMAGGRKNGAFVWHFRMRRAGRIATRASAAVSGAEQTGCVHRFP